MGRVSANRQRRSKNKQFKKQHDVKRRRRDIDQIQDDLRKELDTGKPLSFALDEDLPGLGQHYCVVCGRHFHDASTLESHGRSRDHKRRLKDVAQKQYSQAEADWAAGKTKEELPKVRGTEAGVGGMEMS